MDDLPLDIEELVKMMEEMAKEPNIPYVRQPGEMNSYEKYNKYKEN